MFVTKYYKIGLIRQLSKAYILYIYVDDKHEKQIKRNLINKFLYSYLPYLLPLLTHEEIEKDFRGT